MKKILATLITLAMLMALPCALGEEIPAINWEDVNIEETGIEGSWYVLNDVAVQYWAPDIFENRDITEDDDETMVGKLVLPDDSAAIYCQYIEGFEGATMEELIAGIEEGGAEDIERCTLNGLDAVSYSMSPLSRFALFLQWVSSVYFRNAPVFISAAASPGVVKLPTVTPA